MILWFLTEMPLCNLSFACLLSLLQLVWLLNDNEVRLESGFDHD
jgi:hypothetical protein